MHKETQMEQFVKILDEILQHKTVVDITGWLSDFYSLMENRYWMMLLGFLIVILITLRIFGLKKKRNKNIETKFDRKIDTLAGAQSEISESSIEADKTLKDKILTTDAVTAKKTGLQEEDVETSEIESEEKSEKSIEDKFETIVDQKPKKKIDPKEIEPSVPISFFKKLKNGLTKTRKTFAGSLDRIFAGNRKIDDELLEDIEELLITSDIGVSTAMDLIECISKKTSDISSAEQLKEILKKEILTGMEKIVTLPDVPPEKQYVIFVAGVNGVGKTTTLGKLASRFTREGKKVLIVAADTFRAAAAEQLTVWADRANAGIVKHKENSDPAAVAYDGIEAAIARDVDIVLVDTAGRLHTRINLMEELKKIKRTIEKKLPGAPHEILMVLDATTGQNALTQAEMFNKTLGITAIALTKLDGTAKGGIVISICNTLNVPLKYIGIGEQVDDLQDFDPANFVDALFD